jgi:hypothetical protein
MEPDVEVNFLTTTGTELRADWTQQAEENLMRALAAELAASGETVVMYAPGDTPSADAQQTLLLQEAVTDALAAHVVFMDMYSFQGVLPHKGEEVFPYTLGDSVRALAPEGQADYALFMTSRSTIESGGVFWTKVMIGVATGYTPASSNFRGVHIALVDLRTGEVVWLQGTVFGDPRNPAEAATMISNLLENGPLAQP